MSNILELNGVCKSFKGFALQDVSLTLPEGFVMGFIGQNGAGKTTTIKLILNMLIKDQGSIRVFEQDHLRAEQAIKERIGVVLDQPFYVDEWTLRDVENSLRPFYRKWSKAKYKELLERFDLDPKKKVKDLSRGMKMKLMIAVALSHEADLLILDEPTSGLDAVARDELLQIFGEFMSDERKGILFSSHITADLERIADYITYIQKGRIRYSGTKDDLLEKYVVVKGGQGMLTTEQEHGIIGLRRHSVGFDGLVERQHLQELPSGLLTEVATLDEIIVRFGKSTQNIRN